MAAPSVHGAVHRKSSGDRPNSTEGNPPPPPPRLSPGDLISELPDDVIHHIFSFLPLRDVVKTSVLSRRWRSTWTSTAHLAFDGFRPRNRSARSFLFPSLVGGVLSQCTSPTVKKFHVTNFKYRQGYRPKLDLWLGFASGRRVEDLRVLPITDRWTMYKLPPFLYCSSWLVRLEVGSCCFSPGVTISWPCLKVLLMELMDLSNDILGRILSGSPVLESLELRWCWGVKNITIDSTSVKELVLVSLNSCVEQIRAPHLLSLRVTSLFVLSRHMFRLVDLSSLVEAELVFSIRTPLTLDQRLCYDTVKELCEKLRGVPTITIGGWCLKILSVLEMEGVPPLLSTCQSLILHTPITPWHLPGIAYMLRSSQCLERLVIRQTGTPRLKEESKESFNYDKEDFLCSRRGSFQCLVKHLKRVEIIVFTANSLGSKHLLTLIKFLLGNTLALEKMIIKADFHTRNGQKRLQALSKLLGMSRNVLSYRRASKNAEVIFDYPLKLVSF